MTPEMIRHERRMAGRRRRGVVARRRTEAARRRTEAAPRQGADPRNPPRRERGGSAVA